MHSGLRHYRRKSLYFKVTWGVDGRARTDNLCFTKLRQPVPVDLVAFHHLMISAIRVPSGPVLSRSSRELCCQNCCHPLLSYAVASYGWRLSPTLSGEPDMQ